MRGVRGGIGRAAGAALLGLAGVAATHLGAQLVGAGVAADVTQVMLMPLLLVVLLAGTAPPHGRLVRLFALGLGLSWLGDTLPRFLEGQAQFLAMLGAFLLAQGVYALALWPLRGDSLLVRPLAALPYLLAAVVIVALCAPGAGALLPALVVYAAAICAMAVLATALGPRGAIGGAVFVLSDALIALDTFGVLTLPAHAVWVMATYVAAQLLLVLGVLDRDAEVRAAGSP
jgi:uncharacterized membrane protein YhhN